jgi:hypothetical protein
MTASIHSLGGQAAAKVITPEQRREWGRKGALKQARTLGKEGRRLRALKGAATKRANTLRPCETCGGSGAHPGGRPCLGCEGTGSLDLVRPMSEAPPVVQAVAKIFEGPVPKAKRPEPRATSQNGRVLALMRSAPERRWTSEQLAESLVPCDLEGTRNALSSLRTAGHVVSESVGDSKREKLWRLT